MRACFCQSVLGFPACVCVRVENILYILQKYVGDKHLAWGFGNATPGKMSDVKLLSACLSASLPAR